MMNVFWFIHKMPLKVKTSLVEFTGLVCPFRAGVFGSTRTGKTTLIYNILKNNMIQGKVNNIYYAYPQDFSNEPPDWHADLPYDIEYIDFLPDLDFIQSVEEDSILILDDFWLEACKSKVIRNIFTSVSGKRNISVFITSQNPYDGSLNARTIRNNLNYYFLFKNLGDHQINKRLCQQLGYVKQYNKALTRMNNDPRGFVMINLDVNLKYEQLRVMTNIFDDPLVYV